MRKKPTVFGEKLSGGGAGGGGDAGCEGGANNREIGRGGLNIGVKMLG